MTPDSPADHRRSSEADLLAALARHEPLALAEAYHRTVGAAHACARRLLAGADDVEALLRDVYAGLWREPPSQGPLEAHVRARSFALGGDLLRQRGAAPASPSTALLLTDLPAPDVRYLDAAERALKELPEGERLALLRAHDQGTPATAQQTPDAAGALERALLALAGPDTAGVTAAGQESDGCDDLPLGDWCLGLLGAGDTAAVERELEARPGCAERSRSLRRGRRRLEGLPATPDTGHRVLVTVLTAAMAQAAPAPAATPSPPPAPPAPPPAPSGLAAPAAAAPAFAGPPIAGPTVAPAPPAGETVDIPASDLPPVAPAAGTRTELPRRGSDGPAGGQAAPDGGGSRLGELPLRGSDGPAGGQAAPDGGGSRLGEVDTDELAATSALDQAPDAPPASSTGAATGELRLSDLLAEEGPPEEFADDDLFAPRRPEAAEPASRSSSDAYAEELAAIGHDGPARPAPQPWSGATATPVFDESTQVYVEGEDDLDGYGEDALGRRPSKLVVALTWILPILAGGALGLFVALYFIDRG